VSVDGGGLDVVIYKDSVVEILKGLAVVKRAFVVTIKVVNVGDAKLVSVVVRGTVLVSSS